MPKMMAVPGTGELTAALTVCAALVTAACAWLAVLLMILPAASSVLFAVFVPFSAIGTARVVHTNTAVA